MQVIHFPTVLLLFSLKGAPPGIVAYFCILKDPISSSFLADDGVVMTKMSHVRRLCPFFLDITQLLCEMVG